MNKTTSGGYAANLSGAPVGKLVLLIVDKLRIAVRISQARRVYGREEYLVRPCEGQGEQWVSKTKLVGL